MRGQTPTRPAKWVWPAGHLLSLRRERRQRGAKGTPLEPRMVLSAFFLGKPPQRGRLNHPLYKKRLPPRNQTVAILLIYDHPPPVCIWLLQITGTGTVFIERKSRVPALTKNPGPAANVQGYPRCPGRIRHPYIQESAPEATSRSKRRRPGRLVFRLVHPERGIRLTAGRIVDPRTYGHTGIAPVFCAA